jgi:hypothetical protein
MIHQDFTGDYRENAEKSGNDIANSITKCPFCLNERGLEIVCGNSDAWIDQNPVRNETTGENYEHRSWISVYHYLLRCKSCKEISFYKFSWGSKVDNDYENAFERAVDEWQELGYSPDVSMQQGAKVQLMYPYDSDEDLVKCKEIASVSPNFVKIYTQAYTAEKRGLTEICGMGYRKALENLVVDFAIYKNGLSAADILAIEDMPKNLIEKIHKYYNDMPDFIACAERAAWIGNDETHLIKKQVNFSISNMKELIGILVQCVKLKVMAEHYKSHMPPVK